MVFGAGQHVAHLENGLFKIFRLVCGSSAQALSCWSERRRQTGCAAAAGGLAEWPRAWLLSITACLNLNHSMVLACFSLSLLIQVHEAAAVVESGGDAGAEWRPATAQRRTAADDGSGA